MSSEFNIIFYFIPLVFLILYYSQVYPAYLGTLLSTLFLKIGYAFIMLFLIETRYHGGDLETYFYRAIDQSDSFIFSFYYFNGSLLIASLHGLIFKLFGPSLFGISLFMALLSHYALTKLLFAFFKRNESFSKKKVALGLLFLHLFPFVGLQSTFVGKDPWVLLFISIIASRLQMQFKDFPLIIISVVMIFLIRPYQGLLTGFVLGSIFLGSQYILSLKSLVIILSITSLAFFGLYALFSYIDSILMAGGIQAFLVQAYPQGNQLVEPYPQPLTILQGFRPFPWDSSNLILFLSSLENLIFFYFFIVMLPTIKHVLQKFRSDSVDNIYRFSVLYIVGFLLLFMYSENLGDLSRRHIYYFPFIFLVYFFGAKRLGYLKITRGIRL